VEQRGRPEPRTPQASPEEAPSAEPGTPLAELLAKALRAARLAAVVTPSGSSTVYSVLALA